MKNKILFSLALATAANAFIATPVMGYTLDDAKRDAMNAGKATLATGKALIGGFASLNAFWIYGCAKEHFEDQRILPPAKTRSISRSVSHVAKHPGVFCLALSAVAGYIGYSALRSAWNDYKSINNNK
jgi:hypothetical protein